MKKKVLSIVIALLACMGVQAQIVSSTSRSIKSERVRPSETLWYLRGGLDMTGFAGDGAEGLDRKAAYNFALGFQKPIASMGAYWGMDFGLGARGYKVDDEKLMANNIQISPFTFGWKYEVVDNLENFAKDSDLIIANRLDAEIQAYVEKVYTRDLYMKN